jgi:hypothetical protein
VSKFEELRKTLQRLELPSSVSSVTPAEASGLIARINKLELELRQRDADFKVASSETRMKSAELDTLQIELQAQKNKVAQIEKDNFKAKDPIVKELLSLKVLLEETKKQLREAKSAGVAAADLKTLEKERLEYANAITELNLQANALNAEVDKEKKKSKRLSDHVLTLSTDLNLAQAKTAIGMADNSGKPVATSFASLVSKGDLGPVSLFNTAYRALSGRSKDILNRHAEIESSNVAGRLANLDEALSHSNAPIYRPYKKVVHDAARDALAMTYDSRKHLTDFVEYVLWSLSPTGKPLTETALLLKIEEIDAAAIRYKANAEAILSKKKHHVLPGSKEISEKARGKQPRVKPMQATVQSAVDSDEELETLIPEPVVEDEMVREEMHLLWDSDNPEPAPPQPVIVKKLTEGFRCLSNAANKSWRELRVHLKKRQISLSTRVKKFLARHEAESARMLRLINGNFFYRICAPGYSWYLSIKSLFVK